MNLPACAANNDTVCRATSLARAIHNLPTPHEMARWRAVQCPDELSVHSTHLGNGVTYNPACDAVIGRGRHDRPAFQCAPACQYLSSIDASVIQDACQWPKPLPNIRYALGAIPVGISNLLRAQSMIFLGYRLVIDAGRRLKPTKFPLLPAGAATR